MRKPERQVTDRETIQEILDECKVCRLGMRDGEGVYVLPMNYGYELEGERLTLYFHGAREGKKLDLLRRYPEIGFEMDCGHGLMEGRLACQHSFYYASIIGRGKAAVVEDPAEKLEALKILMKHQTGKDFEEFETNPRLEKAVAIVKVEAESYTCKMHQPKEE